MYSSLLLLAGLFSYNVYPSSAHAIGAHRDWHESQHRRDVLAAAANRQPRSPPLPRELMPGRAKQTSKRVQIPYPALAARGTNSTCIDPNPQNTLTDRMNLAFNSSGPGFILSLCQGADYYIEAPINFAAHDQEISTEGYPIEEEDGTDLRATLIVSGPVSLGQGHTTALQGTCDDCDGIKIRHIRINGTRGNAGPTNGGANIEIGGANSGQLVEYVKSWDPRSWSCLHVFEGGLQCRNTTLRYNDIGPCGSDYFQYWADGLSVACADSHVHGNWINTATDGGIVLFGSPGTVVENNTIWVETAIMLGGINMVDYDPWNGNFSDTIVRNNNIYGGFANSPQGPGQTKGDNNVTAMIKIGVAIGPRVWFGDRYGTGVSQGGQVIGNTFTGAFGYAIAIDSADNFTIQENVLVGNTAFIGSDGPNCTSFDQTPTPEPFVEDAHNVTNSNIQDGFVKVPDGESLTCIVPNDGNYWPYGGQPKVVVPGEQTNGDEGKGKRVAEGVGIAVGILGAGLLAWWIRRWYLSNHPASGGPGLRYAAGLPVTAGVASGGVGTGEGVGNGGPDMRSTSYPFGAGSGVASQSAVGHGLSGPGIPT